MTAAATASTTVKKTKTTTEKKTKNSVDSNVVNSIESAKVSTDSTDIAKTTKTSKSAKVSKKSATPAAILPGAGVVYLSRIPHGFYEEQMRAYFSQFGEITRLRMARNKRSGASKHFAFIEFRHEAVAKIVVETMHNYLMFGRLLQCCLVPADKIHPETFVGANRKFKIIPWKKIARETHNVEDTAEKAQLRKEKQLKHIKSVEERCKELGISWDSNDL
jgi:nucleolar protein 15